MKITRQADYAARAVLHLAQAGNNERVSTGHVAKAQNIPLSFLAKIISQLLKAGILQTSRGAQGGIRLAREPEKITLLEVVEAIDGPIQLNVCIRREGVCVFEDNCPLQSVWCDVQNELITKLRNANFAQLIA
jgi:Rrf2 family protein